MSENTVECRLYELISGKGGLDNRIKFLSTEKHYYNALYFYNNKNKKLLLQVEHEKLINIIIN
jgi:hypothetical protein